MSFQLYISDRQQAYLDGLPLSPQAKERINRFLEFIANVPDGFRLDPENRPKPDSPYFRVQHILWDRWGDEYLHSIDFHIKDDKADSGDLQMVFIDHKPGNKKFPGICLE